MAADGGLMTGRREVAMIVERKWFCRCSGKERELVFVENGDDEAGEPTCPSCGAAPSSDPKHTIGYRDEEKRGGWPA
jgi:hypothetical protein